MRMRFVAVLMLLPTLGHAQEKPKLPRVLILGDSISIGYTAPVRKLLDGKAEVVRPNTNCQHTAFGLANLDKWLGKETWDAIHFNWGIWDTHLLDANGALVRNEDAEKVHVRHTAEKYRENMTRIVKTLEKTGAKLVFATTTPIMYRKGPRFEVIKDYNAVAAALMREHKIAVNDLYAYVLPNVKAWQSGDQVHFNAAGNQKLAERVSASILEALAKK